MTTVEGEAAQASKAPLPDYFADPDAVLKDAGVAWRYGRAPDYTKTRKYFNESKYRSAADVKEDLQTVSSVQYQS